MPLRFKRRQVALQAVVGRDLRARAAARRGHQRFGLFFGQLFFVAQLGQLRRGGGQLIAHRGQVVFQDLALLPRLGQQRFQLLVVAVERAGAALQFLVALLQRRLAAAAAPGSATAAHRDCSRSRPAPAGKRTRASSSSATTRMQLLLKARSERTSMFDGARSPSRSAASRAAQNARAQFDKGRIVAVRSARHKSSFRALLAPDGAAVVASARLAAAGG